MTKLYRSTSLIFKNKLINKLQLRLLLLKIKCGSTFFSGDIAYYCVYTQARPSNLNFYKSSFISELNKLTILYNELVLIDYWTKMCDVRTKDVWCFARKRLLFKKNWNFVVWFFFFFSGWHSVGCFVRLDYLQQISIWLNILRLLHCFYR